MNVLRLPIFREVTAVLLVAGLLLQSATAVAPGPAWWGSQSVADPDALPDDFSAANVGQLKYLATKAAAALEAELPGGAGTAINALTTSWNSPPASGVTRDDYLAINQGQLKTVAALFYDRLGQPYPWAGSSAARDDYQLVNLGQLKHVFAFELKFRGPGSLTQIPAATLAAALAQWQALPVKPAGSSADDFDGDGIPNLQEYLMGKPLFDPLDIDGDRILDSVEDSHPGVLSKLRFADAVEDYDGDGVMNYEEVLLGLNLASATTSGRADGLGDSEVLAWTLAAGPTLTPNTDAVRALWEVIDADWIDREAGSYYLYWLLETLVNGVPAGLTSFRADVANWAWQPWNPGVWLIESPSLAHDPNWEPVDLDGNGVADFDRDNENLPDPWEYRYSLNLRNGQDGNSDPDGDQLPNWQEYANGTNPRLADSDGDGFNDAVELWQGGDPVQQSGTPPLVLQVVDSNYQAIYTGQTTPALAVKVTQGGLPVAGVTVAFQLNEGVGRLKPASSTVGTPGSSLSQTTASNGIAAVTYESATGEPEGTASISAGLAGASASQNFTVSIVAIPTAYGSAGGNEGTGGGSGGVSANPTRVPTPPRSTAMSAAEIAAASADGYRIRVKRKSNSQSSYPADAASPEYLSPFGLSPAALVGWQDPFETHSWADHTRLEFEALPPPPPSKEPVIPSGARRYLVLVYQGKDVGSDTSGPPKYVGVLTFQYKEIGAREITLTGGIPETFIKKNGNESVTIEPPLATKAEERVWITLGLIEVKQIPLAPDRINTAGYHDGNNWVDAEPASTRGPRFARWRNGFTEPAGQFKQDWIKNDPDRVIIRIDGDVIDPAVPLGNLKVNGISGVSGQESDMGLLELTQKAGGWESEPFLFVTDSIDDAQYNGDQGQDDSWHDQTRLASFGSDISIKVQLKGQSTGTEILIGKMETVQKKVKVEINVFQGVNAVTAGDKANAQAAFDATRLLYRQIGVDLVQQVDPKLGAVKIVNLAAGFASFIHQNGGFIDYSTPVDWNAQTPTGQKFTDYLDSLSAGTSVLKVYFTTANLMDYGRIMGHGDDPLGWGIIRGDYCIVELNNPRLDLGYIMAHEIGHVLGARHPVGAFPNRIMGAYLPPTNGDHKDPRRFGMPDEQSFVGGKFYK